MEEAMKVPLEDRILRRLLRIGDTENLSEMARALRVSRSEIEEAVAGMDECDLIVGVRGGVWLKSAHLVERYQ
jgi:DNA-binding GntR family transcriptional regulator